MTNARVLAATCSASALASALIWATPGWAQQTAQPAARGAQLQEIIVTARKRQESILNVPIVETAIPQQQLQRFQTQDLKDIATLVPGLAVGESVLAIGTQISLRGVGTTAYDPGIDQSVSLNIDGLQLSQGLAYSSGMFDLGQVEVLKGPQALFFGKSSPGGVISLRTADPTDKFEVIARAGYEFEASEKRGEIIISGPVTDTLKLRLASMYDSQDGFYDNAASGLALLGARDPASKKLFPSKAYQIRGTALWNPTSQFDARLKINQVHDRTPYAGSQQYVSCPDGTGAPLGIPFIGGGEDCKLDRTYRVVDYNPAAFPVGLENNGTPFVENTQTYGSLELNYKLMPGLTATSVTAYYSMHDDSELNTTNTTFAPPALSVTDHFKRHDVTEEIRLNSDFAGPLNFTLGGFYQRGGFSDLVFLGGNTFLRLPPVLAKGSNNVDTKTNSVFGQLRWQIIPQVELAAGARWSDEKRSDAPMDYTTGTPIPVPIPNPRIHSNNVSPEVTVTYKPTADMTVFGALKRGYKSGSFNIAAPPVPNVDNSFGDEKAEGYEVGVKSRMLDRRLLANLAFYDYRYTGLQVGGIINSDGLPVTKTVNAGSSLVYGVDFDVAYRPEQIEGLGLSAAVEWNRGHFKTLNNAPCYGGQTIAAGCNLELNPRTGLFTAQDLSGSPLIRAPEWQVNFGFDYETDIGNGMKVVLSSNNHYSSKYNTNLDLAYYQKSFIKADVNITLQGPGDRWEFALIGKNLNDARTSGNCSNFNAQNGSILGGQITGGTGRGPAGVDEIACFTDRGREVWLRLTLKPFQ